MLAQRLLETANALAHPALGALVEEMSTTQAGLVGHRRHLGSGREAPRSLGRELDLDLPRDGRSHLTLQTQHVARGPLVGWLWLSVGLVMLPDLMWGSWGFAQFGYRRILDAAPLLLVLLGIGFRERIGWFWKAAVVVGIAVHAYGIWVINVLGFVQ